ncbi:MAG TPA: GAF domain-containing SpoIIE family protein phosphatase [Acidimicrobiales bacterium]|nr:GAF domain-containing SpoIIE family protein phosphatase [Acidimicrobiales bacterium]
MAEPGRLDGGGSQLGEIVAGEAGRDALLARLTLLSEASTVLTETLDPNAALRRLAQLVVPVLGDWCGVHVMDEAGVVRTAVAAHGDQGGMAWLQEDELETSPGLASTSPVASVLKDGEPQLISAVTDETLASSANSPEQLDFFRTMGVESAVVVPLRGRARVLGALSVVSAESGRRLDDADLAVAVDLGRKAGLAVENAQLYQRARHVAKAFEQVLVPEQLAVPGLEVAARYLPAAGAEVGGDWYDVIPLSDGRVGLVIGDVIGHDLRASSIMASLRTAVRAYAWTGSPPAAVVDDVDELARGLEADHMATLIYGIYEPATRRLRWSNAGHLPPLVIGPSQTAIYLEEPSSVLVGAMGGLSYSEGELELEPGSTVLLYTDGLVQERGSLVSECLHRLSRLVVTEAGTDPDQLINRIVATTLGEDQPADDIAMLCVRVKP